MTYQQLEAMRLRALEIGLNPQWCGRREEDEGWLRVSSALDEIVTCWFPGRAPILSVQVQTHAPLELAHTALELVALHAALTADLGEPMEPRETSAVSCCDSCALARRPDECAAAPDCPAGFGEVAP